jgi:hypothetical protein
VFDHELATTPATRIRHATLETVTTAGGKYQIFWAHSEDQGVWRQLCADGPIAAHDTGFAASRLSQ